MKVDRIGYGFNILLMYTGYLRLAIIGKTLRKLNEKERTWINLMLEPEFFGKKELIRSS